MRGNTQQVGEVPYQGSFKKYPAYQPLFLINNPQATDKHGGLYTQIWQVQEEDKRKLLLVAARLIEWSIKDFLTNFLYLDIFFRGTARCKTQGLQRELSYISCRKFHYM